MRIMNGGSVIDRILVRRRREQRTSRAIMGLMIVAGVVGLFMFLREMPNLRRHMKIERL
jgi:hypothetical protein